MKIRLFLLCLLSILLLPVLPAHAIASPESLPPRFQRISVDEGLSNAAAMCILQDRDGFLWVCTQNGLNLYDGYRFTVFRPDPKNPYSLQSSIVLAGVETPDGMLWFGTDGAGLARYDKALRRFIHYRHDPGNPRSLPSDSVWSLFVDSQGTLWVGSRGGLSRWDGEDQGFTNFLPTPADSRPLSKWVLRIGEDSRGALWVGTRYGLNRFDRQSQTFSVFLPDAQKPGTISSEQVWAIYEDSRGTLWLGTRFGGLVRFDPVTETFTAYRRDPANPASLSDDTVWDILETPDGMLWPGTEKGGVNRFDPITGTFEAFRTSINNPESLSSDDIYRLFLDRSGVLWAGSRNGGLNKLSPARQRFTLLKAQPGDPHGLSTSNLFALWTGGDGILWVGTQGGGLNKVNRRTGEVTVYRNDPLNPGSLGGDTITAFYAADPDTLWIATSGGGLSRMEIPSETFTTYLRNPDDPASLPSNFLTSMVPAGQGKFWLGTLGFGLVLFDPATGRAQTYRHQADQPASLIDDTVNVLLSDGNRGLWVGTHRGGLDYLDFQSGEFRHALHDPANPFSLSDNTVFSLYRDRQGTLWVGTLSGLNRYDPALPGFRAYHLADGLPNETVYGILEDESGYLWLSTARGLARLDPVSGEVLTYTLEDGLQSNQFNQYSAFRAPDGELLFGGPGGLNAFYPEQLTRNETPPAIVFSGFSLFNQPLPVGGEVLPQDINTLTEISLRYDQNVFSIEFAALDYQNPAQNRYQYKLEGFDRDWLPAGEHRSATYTNLNPGTYTFLVRASNNDGVWSEKPRAVHIVIRPPWWQTQAFYLLMLAALGGLVVGIIRWRTAEMRRRTRELEHAVEDRTRELSGTNQKLEEEIRERINVQRELEYLVSTDPLTGVYNRRFFFTSLDEEFAQVSPPERRRYAVILLDVDHFKNINDQHGHLVGDQVLVTVADMLRKYVRTSDIVARYGGEEFVIYMPETTAGEARSVAERIRRMIEEQTRYLHGFAVTVSVGVAVKALNEEVRFDEVLRRADAALYAAKHRGRNCVVLDGEKKGEGETELSQAGG
ncbi:diguanylate cyclase [Anaerolinea sp.]|uniref:diguanylate cyclase n=1 Tax=Anaerolinea sp. TaxID=1872519 RepID=UPI002FDB8F8F